MTSPQEESSVRIPTPSGCNEHQSQQRILDTFWKISDRQTALAVNLGYPGSSILEAKEKAGAIALDMLRLARELEAHFRQERAP